MPGMLPPTDLVIFDCDGVLVDSERIAVEIDLVILERVGLTMTRQEVIERFVGRSPSVMYEVIEAQLGSPPPPKLRAEFEQLYVDAYERDLVPVPGIVDALEELDRPMCVASSSTPEALRRKLTKTGLYDKFEGRIFSAVEVRNGKPAPDLFLYAADRMGVEPTRCVVIEDSLYGVMAGRAAGMRVLAFASELIDAVTLEGNATTLFTDMADLVSLIDDSPAPGLTE
jgi:HAD superfamily hydrolase (TIGR01509 family)